MKYIVYSIIGILVVAMVVHFIAEARFKSFAADLMQQVSAETPPKLVSKDLPPAIVNFVKKAGVEKTKLAATIRLTQQAEMRLDKGGDWQKLTAEQVISTGAMGFVWLAEQKMGPLTKFRVIDAYVAGQGRLHVRAMGSVPIANYMGEDADIAEMMRYLGELVWAPDAMIGNSALNWEELSDKSVYVWVKMPSGKVGVTFVFDDAGDIIEVHAKDRPAEVVDGKAVLRDWQIKVGGHKDFGGRRVPSTGEVGYIYDDGYEAYWRGEVTGYEF